MLLNHSNGRSCYAVLASGPRTTQDNKSIFSAIRSDIGSHRHCWRSLPALLEQISCHCEEALTPSILVSVLSSVTIYPLTNSGRKLHDAAYTTVLASSFCAGPHTIYHSTSWAANSSSITIYLLILPRAWSLARSSNSSSTLIRSLMMRSLTPEKTSLNRKCLSK